MANHNDPERDEGAQLSTQQKLGQLYELIDKMEIALMTTRRADGSLVSRPMATQARADGSDLWFVTNADTAKIEELESDPHVNLAYYSSGSYEFVSVSGTARISRDPQRIRELYSPDWRAWFGDEGGAKNGGPEDPRIVLVLVEAQSATYLKARHGKAVTLFNVVKGAVTGTRPQVGTKGDLGQAELQQGRGGRKY
ncbi:MAG TPA: pyridoxamine 5'-phosphate oxidase family protein [Polyangiaceae bacterium]|nr:pyridoxamine 5'-phosphate oxidase family protein [Polyangiaceae bacterium]